MRIAMGQSIVYYMYKGSHIEFKNYDVYVLSLDLL